MGLDQLKKIIMTISTGKSYLDWFLKQDGRGMVIVLLLVIVGYLGYKFDNYQEEQALEMKELKTQIDDCLSKDQMINDLQNEIKEMKLKFIILQSNANESPNAQWITDAATNNILWINAAYETKYLKPKGKIASDLIGTNGYDIFGEENVSRFITNNIWVISNKKPKTFREIEETLKYPITIGEYIFAIGGMEYQHF